MKLSYSYYAQYYDYNHNYCNYSYAVVHIIEVLQGVRLSLNGFSHHRFSPDSLDFSAILRVKGIGRYMAKTIVTIVI